MGAFVPQISGPQQGIHYGVDQHITVAVTYQSLIVGDGHASQHQPAARRQAVGVEPDTDSKCHDKSTCGDPCHSERTKRLRNPKSWVRKPS